MTNSERDVPPYAMCHHRINQHKNVNYHLIIPQNPLMNKQKRRRIHYARTSIPIIRNRAGNTYAKLLQIVERNQARFNTENHAKWYQWDEDEEADFIEKIVPLLQLDIRKTPEKDIASWAIDLIDYTNNRPADLKVQNTPFFTVSKYFYCGTSCNPAYSVTFNKKDYENYLANYPSCHIYFWIHWTQLEYHGTIVPEVYGVWRGDFSRMSERIQKGDVPLHQYLNRTTDDHNAKDNYVFDLLDDYVFTKVA